jgi:molybdopterin synthase sulfur carrier subunit
MITVKYFASLKESLGRSQDLVEPSTVATVQDVWAKVAIDTDLSSNLLIAVNLEYADMNHRVNDGDEVAFFPPVTGG